MSSLLCTITIIKLSLRQKLGYISLLCLWSICSWRPKICTFQFCKWPKQWSRCPEGTNQPGGYLFPSSFCFSFLVGFIKSAVCFTYLYISAVWEPTDSSWDSTFYRQKFAKWKGPWLFLGWHRRETNKTSISNWKLWQTSRLDKQHPGER